VSVYAFVWRRFVHVYGVGMCMYMLYIARSVAV